MKNSGFSILELSVVLTVIALIAGSALAIGATRIQAAKTEDTDKKMQAIIEVLDAFVQNYGYLPCPADPQASPSAANFGLGEVDEDGNCTASNLLGSGNIRIGVVPSTTLRLAPSIMMDGWNRRITYAVDQRFTFTVADPAAGYKANNPDIIAGDFIRILSTSSPATLITDKAVVALVSHGANGHGAWPGKGAAAPLNNDSTDADERENSNLNADGGINLSFVQKFPTETFDDIVYYRMKWQFPAVNE